TPPPPVLPLAGRGFVVGAALLLAGALLVGSWHLEEAKLSGAPDVALDHARLARRLLPPWAEPRVRTAGVLLFQGKVRRDDALLAEGRAWKREAARREPDDPLLWSDLGLDELGAHLDDAADRDLRHALALDPWSARALNGLGHLALDRGRPVEARRWFTRSLRVAPGQRGVRQLLRGL